MEIRIKIREISKVTMKSKDALVRIVQGYGYYTIGPCGTYLSPDVLKSDTAIVANYQLVRGKTKQTKDVVEQHVQNFDQVELMVEKNRFASILFWDIENAL